MSRFRERRFDFRGGVNRTWSEDTKDSLEVSLAQNCRTGEVYGALTKLAGSQLIHTDELESGATIDGIFQWDHATAKLIAICNGDLFHKTLAATTWTNVASTLSTTNRAIFQQHVVAGSPTLYFANGTFNKWTGAALTKDVSGSPAATYIAYYKGRMFAVDGTKTVYWSKVADPDTWTAPDGGSAPVGVSDAEGLVGLCPVGVSLLLFKEDSISRFTGTTQDTISIDAETEGISADVGCAAPGTIVRVENFVFFLSRLGAYIATEAGIQSVGTKIEADLRDIDRTIDDKAWAVHNQRRNEVWLFIPEAGETTNNRFWIWSYRTDAWTGPHFFSQEYDAAVACRYERSGGTESILVGGYDGYVRDGDVATLGRDNVTLADAGPTIWASGLWATGLWASTLWAGTGAGDTGTAITMKVTLPELLFGNPHVYKRLTSTQTLRADLRPSGSLSIICNSESQAEDTLTLATLGAGVDTYEFRPYLVGHAPILALEESTKNIIQINGLDLVAAFGRRK